MTTSLALPVWTDSAACAQTDPELFYPEKGASPLVAIRVCADCPVRRECLNQALTWESQPGNLPYGVWGGLTAEQRRTLTGHTKPSRPTAPCPDCGTPTRTSERTGQPRRCGLCTTWTATATRRRKDTPA